ncbi:hypothetical protein BLS_003579 [Venturia inaequalis]|uniref:Uncharacterized protein n=1 Tax=Venturia inaequalis TaxID=5025 RepID=A0A8H3UMA9_VENIN|nr:hypothetical protein BLS_003579 [Venturia inaequalis]RDI78704.1 Heat shock protein [Venturia inaequalis]
MPLPMNWIKVPGYRHILPPELTSEDLTFAKYDKIHEYYLFVKLVWLIRTQALPNDLRIEVRESTPADVCRTLQNAVKLGAMDTGWADEYFTISEEVSVRMSGFPKEFLIRQRRLQSLISNPPNPHTESVPQSKPTKKLAGFHFLRLPDAVRQRIYRFILVRKSDIQVGDFDFGVEPRGFFRRTEYSLYDSKERRQRRTTYTVRLGKFEPPINFNVMLLNKTICAEAQKIFYGENRFAFLGTAESALSFFHDRASRLDTLRKISMRYSCSTKSFKGCYNATCPIPLPSMTSAPAWRRIFNLFVHTSIGLEDFHLVLDDSFWHQLPEIKGAEAIFNKPRLCEPSYNLSNDRNFLQHVARLGGVNIRLTIDGEGGRRERVVFRRDLEQRLQQHGFKRPYLADDTKPECTCRKKLLFECCIWDKQGKMRRG